MNYSFNIDSTHLIQWICYRCSSSGLGTVDDHLSASYSSYPQSDLVFLSSTQLNSLFFCLLIVNYRCSRIIPFPSSGASLYPANLVFLDYVLASVTCR